MKKIFGCPVAVLFVVCLIPMASAEEFAFKDYSFVWNVAKEGDVTLIVKKEPGGMQFLLGSRGGKLATVPLTAAEAEAVGGVLQKTDSYYTDHRAYYDANRESNKPAFDQEKTDTIKVQGCQVIFYSSPRGTDFSVKVGKDKTFTSMALLSRESALAMGKHLAQAEAMAKFVNQHLKF